MENNLNNIDKARTVLRDLQGLLFDNEASDRDIFEITLKMDNLLNEASIDYNKYLNEKEKK